MSEDIRKLLDSLGYTDVPDSPKEMARIGIDIMREWHEALPEPMRIPLAAMCLSYEFLIEQQKDNKDEEKQVEIQTQCLMYLLQAVFNMGYRMGQHQWRDPYKNPVKFNPEAN